MEAEGQHAGRRGRVFRPEIQGLRAVGVALVVLYHVWLGRVSGGVDAFLRVPAFLMTGKFVARHRRGEPTHLLKHWLHVFRRLLPAAAVTIAGTVIAAVVALPPTRWSAALEEGFASLTYAENWVLLRDAVDYYAQDDALASPFQHFWSLSIQGQPFILFPLLFVAFGALARRRGLAYEKVLAVGFAAVFAASFAFSVWSAAVDQEQAYFSLPARVWEFALGSSWSIGCGSAGARRSSSGGAALRPSSRACLSWTSRACSPGPSPCGPPSPRPP